MVKIKSDATSKQTHASLAVQEWWIDKVNDIYVNGKISSSRRVL